MVKRRPDKHFELPHYEGLPKPPYRVELEKIPDPVKLMVLMLRHVEPLASDLLSKIDPLVDDFPHEDEKAFYREIDPDFQLIFLVINSIFGMDKGEYRTLLPYSMSLVPSTKREKVSESKFDLVDAFSSGVLSEEHAYLHLDPFSGNWGFFSQLNLIAEMGQRNAFTDQFGIVHDYYFLRKGVNLSEVAQPSIGVEEARMTRFLRHRARLLYQPFTGVGARQIWGVENGLELFALQEMVRQEIPWPTIQAHVYDDGQIYPTLYNAWSDRESMNDQHFIAEVDFCFEDEKVVVFCDGAIHRRRKVQARDAAINERLENLGFDVIRIPSVDILSDIEKALSPVKQRLS